jgi:hypothetical protein
MLNQHQEVDRSHDQGGAQSRLPCRLPLLRMHVQARMADAGAFGESTHSRKEADALR